MESAYARVVATTRLARQRACALVLTLAVLLSSALALADGDAMADIVAAIDAGQFHAAETRIAEALGAANVDANARSALEFQRERMRRILLDFTLSEDDVKARVRKQIPDLTDDEFARWNASGLFERQTIDGRTFYFHLAASNLFRLSAEARTRRATQTPFNDGPNEVANAHHREILDAVNAQHKTFVAPRRVRVTQSITVNADAVPAGEKIRAWIPYPRALRGQQEHIRFIASEPGKHVVAPESAPMRTVYLEKPARAGAPTKFSITYEVTIAGQHHAIDADKVTAPAITPELAPYVAERPPHIRFSEPMRLFSRQIVGDEKNPWRIAQKLFDAVDRVPWAGAREYSTITDIGDYALRAGHADCGQQTLLLMTLLRLNGIPSRWQSGMVFSDGEYDNLHDWGWLYIAPYGWIPMDVTFGRLTSDDPAVAGFYLGGLDAYRIAFNDDYGQSFVPPKTFFRSDTVDSQRGEVEWRGGNLYVDQWDYGFKAQVQPAASATTSSSSARRKAKP